MSDRPTQLQRLVRVLGGLGIAPIVLLSLILVLAEDRSILLPPLIDALKTISAIIISFLGGIHWGVVLATEHPNRSPSAVFEGRSPFWPLIIALVVPFFGWIAIFLNGPMSFALLIVCLLAQGAWDSFPAQREQFPQWFAKLRQILTLVSVVSLTMAMLVSA